MSQNWNILANPVQKLLELAKSAHNFNLIFVMQRKAFYFEIKYPTRFFRAYKQFFLENIWANLDNQVFPNIIQLKNVF